MFDIFIDWLKGILKSRLFPIVLIYIGLFLILVIRIFNLQVINGEEAAEQNELKGTKTREIKSTRGNILDRNGKLIAYNELSFTVTIEDIGALKTSEEKNKMILKLINIIEKNSGNIQNDFPMEINKKGKFIFTLEGNALLRFKRDVYSKKTVDSLTEDEINSTAEDVFKYLRYDTGVNSPKFNITSEYSVEEALKIMGIRYSLFMNRYQKFIPITVATNVNEMIVSAIKENSSELPGVEILQETYRKYNYSECMSHIIGYTGMVSQEKVDESKKDKDYQYSPTDQIGKTGIESEYEDYLRGIKGYEKLTTNSSNVVVDVKERKDSVAGNDVYLTIDAELQEAYYKLLEKKLASILVSNIHSGTDSGSKGTSSDKIRIPIYDVYFSLIDNNVIDISNLNAEDSTNLEKAVHKKFTSNLETVLRQIKQIMAVNSTIVNSGTSSDMESYLKYIYSMLKDNEVIISEKVDKEDKQYINYSNDKISLSEYLQYAISNNWIDLTKLNIGNNYYSTEEIYEKLLNYITTTLYDDQEFHKKTYYSLIYSFKLSGREICLLLYDQGVLKYNEDEITKLQNGIVSSYDFIVNKIKKIEITPAQLALEPCSASIVVTDVKTGEVLAAVSYPGIDNNKMANSIDANYYEKLMTDKSSPSLFRPTQTYTAPGSTYKMCTAIAGLEEGVITTESLIKDLGEFKEVSIPPKCWIYKNGGTHGTINVSDALRDSCNYFFYEVGYRLGKDASGRFNNKLGLEVEEKYSKMLGFDAPSGMELYEYEPKISNEDAVRSAIGQGSNAYTPAQISRYITTIANKGTCYDLTLINKIMDINGKTVLNNSATVHNSLNIKTSTWNAVHEGMYKVVNASSSSIYSIFKDLDIKIAGKTGTAQESTLKPNHALFVSFAPYEDPEISITTVIPNGYTSSNAASLTADAYKYYYHLADLGDLIDGDADAFSAGNFAD